MCRIEGRAEAYIYYAGLGHPRAVRITSSLSSSSSGTKPLPPHVGHCCSSSVPFSMMPSPLHSGQVFTCASWHVQSLIKHNALLTEFVHVNVSTRDKRGQLGGVKLSVTGVEQQQIAPGRRHDSGDRRL